MDANIIGRLQKILALTTSPVEGEAQAAAGMLAKLLAEYNLSIADLESKGHKQAPGVKRAGHDLGKAAFTWKLNLAEAIAKHYFCHPMVDRVSKEVHFVGRPDNVESLLMLYGWVIDQIRRIASDERKVHQATTGEHIDPLRWQVNFGVGAVERLEDRLDEMAAQRASEASTALVIHHTTEISDWMEEQYGYRVDGRKTKQQQADAERYEQYRAERQASKDAAKAAGNMELHYARYPWDRPVETKPLTAAEVRAEAKRQAKADEAWYRKQARKDAAADRKWDNPEYARKQQQAADSRAAGRKAADRVNLRPFLTGEVEKEAARLPA